MKITTKRIEKRVLLIVNTNVDLKNWDVNFYYDFGNEFEAALIHEKLAYEVLPAIAQDIAYKAYTLGWKHAKSKQSKFDSKEYFSGILEKP